MLQEACSVSTDVSVIRRLSFAAVNLHKDTPMYWELVTRFGFMSSSPFPSIEKVKVLLENVEYLDKDAFDSDCHLLRELHNLEGFQGHQLGIVLISANNVCKVCGGKLLVRADRPSFPIIYSNDLGTVEGTHFRKYCQNNWKGFSFTQHYGFHSNGSDVEAVYDRDCFDLPYFLSSHMTVFQTKLLHHPTAEMLLGQVSYRQKSEIYNYIHGYDSSVKKGIKCATNESDADADSSRYV